MSFSYFLKLFAKNVLPEKKLMSIFNCFSVINSLLCCTWEQSQMKVQTFKRNYLEKAKCDLSTVAKTCFILTPR